MSSLKGFTETSTWGAQHCMQQLTKHTGIPTTSVLKHLTGCKVGKTPLSPFFFITPCSLSAGHPLPSRCWINSTGLCEQVQRHEHLWINTLVKHLPKLFHLAKSYTITQLLDGRWLEVPDSQMLEQRHSQASQAEDTNQPTSFLPGSPSIHWPELNRETSY